MKHLLVTNDYPPKIGGIQNYLWELWRRLPPDSFGVLTSPYKSDLRIEKEFDRGESYPIIRSKQSFLLPRKKQAEEIKRVANELEVDFLVFDPALPVGELGPNIGYPYAHVLHGAEVSVPARIPLLSHRLKRTLSGAEFLISASLWATSEAERICASLPPCHYIPPGVDINRFQVLGDEERKTIRTKYQIAKESFLIVSISRLVPRKGLDNLIRAVGKLNKMEKSNQSQKIELLIAGSGRDYKRLQKLIENHDAPARLLGRVEDTELSKLFGIGDIFVMPCRTRWMGMEQEGFGIVFMESASCGVPVVAGKSGGAGEAVLENTTGIILENPNSVSEIVSALKDSMKSSAKLKEMGKAGRKRAEEDFSYDVLAERLGAILKC